MDSRRRRDAKALEARQDLQLFSRVRHPFASNSQCAMVWIVGDCYQTGGEVVQAEAVAYTKVI